MFVEEHRFTPRHLLSTQSSLTTKNSSLSNGVVQVLDKRIFQLLGLPENQGSQVSILGANILGFSIGEHSCLTSLGEIQGFRNSLLFWEVEAACTASLSVLGLKRQCWVVAVILGF